MASKRAAKKTAARKVAGKKAAARKAARKSAKTSLSFTPMVKVMKDFEDKLDRIILGLSDPESRQRAEAIRNDIRAHRTQLVVNINCQTSMTIGF